ncbi:hypothetical protein JHK82_043112 [Glycine max]|nr:hypothetical protein JHK82_043112 [Glycine max]
MPARSRDALCQEFMMKHEYESLKEEDKAWGKKVNFIAGVKSGLDSDLFPSTFYLTDQDIVDYYWMIVFIPSMIVFVLSVVYLIAGTIKVIYAKLSKYGSPLVIFATRHAFLFDTSLKCWLRVTNDYFPASNFASSWCMGLIQSGELAALQVDVRKYLAWKPSLTRSEDMFIDLYLSGYKNIEEHGLDGDEDVRML